MATKPTKQQVAQAKARAGGNNPVKVTNAGLKKLGSAALIAASFTPAGRVARGAATVAKAAKAEGIMAKAGWNKAAKESYRASVKRGTYATPKSGVRVEYNKQAMENAIKSGQSKMKRPDMSPSRPAKSALPRPNLVKIDSSIKAKTADQARANARGLKAANKKK